MSEEPNIYHIPISTLVGSRAEVTRMVDLIETELALRFSKVAVEKSSALQADSPLLRFKEVQGYLKISRSTLYRLVRARELPVYYVGKTMRFYRSDVEKCVVRQHA